MAKLRVGLVGLGEVAQLMHLPLLADDQRFEIAAVTDVSPSLMAHVAERYGVKTRHASAEALIADPTLDAVFILTPDFLHAPLLEKAIRAGKHVFIEKPAALTAAELKPLLELEKSNTKTVFVGYMRRFAPAFTALKERLPPREEIRHVRIRDLIRESQFFVDQTRNIFRPDDVPAEAIAEGRAQTQALLKSVMGEARPDQLRAYQVLTGLSSHSFSAMRELFGAPNAVAAARQHRGENVLVMFDYGSFTALYEAVIHDVARFDAGIEVLTLNQHFKINYDTPYVRNLPTRLEITTSDQHSTGTEIIGPFYEDAFRVELGAFHHAVTTGEKPKTLLTDSLKDLELFAEVGRHFLSQN
ncbi:MAG TPA: Gfo/Idh/MocA family oxidoreductase [Devosia sp.]|jgi:predicted dehydrogenase|uniref:Gfo/Idh/MocA family protein n=1 Tax=Devosia sp. TaxID=1871048 RepID=UPI002DDD7F8E|nr:Gfo/Idh/MocA family oxidoreductase [Devosia sp.]HEV2518711.1 Gfo/Idh/MocA family oxidoreductase [Devosia sp.]